MYEKAVGYIRVSTDKQDFERQRQEIMDYSKKNDFLITKVFEDKQSGSDYADRTGFQDLLLYLKETPEVKIVIFDEVSRMGRDTAQQVTTYKALSKMGVRVFTRGKGEFGANKEDSLLFTVLSAIADYERQTIIDRTSSGRRKVVKDGATQISQQLYGYDLILTKKKNRQVIRRQSIKVNKDEAAAVKTMFQMVDKNGSVNDVIRWLKESRIPSPKGGKVWGKSTVLRILHNTTYHGEWRFGKFYKDGRTKFSMSRRPDKEHIVVKVPKIISKKLFTSVQDKLESNQVKFNPRNQKYTYLLKGLARCQCGTTIQCLYESKSDRRTYRCPQRNINGLQKRTCPIRVLQADFIEKILLHELKAKIEDPDFFKDLKLQKLKQYKTPHIKLQKQIDKMGDEIDKNESLIKKYYEKSVGLIQKNPDKAEFFEALADDKLKENRERKTEVTKLRSALEKLKGQKVNLDMFKDIKRGLDFITSQEVDKFNKASQEKKLEFVRTYIKGVDIKVLQPETKKLLEKIGQLRDMGLYKQGNEAYKGLYYSAFDRQGNPKEKLGLSVMRIEVEFTNNYKVHIDLPYFYSNPEIAVSYLTNGVLQLTK